MKLILAALVALAFSAAAMAQEGAPATPPADSKPAVEQAPAGGEMKKDDAMAKPAKAKKGKHKKSKKPASEPAS